LIAAAAAAVLAVGLLPALGGARTAAAPHAQIGALRARQIALTRAKRDALLDLYSLETRLARSRSALHYVQARSASIARERAATRRRAHAIQHSIAAARTQLARTLRTLYKQGQPDPVAILLGATSVDQAVAGLDDLRRTAKANQRLIARLRGMQVQLTKLDARLQAQSRALAAAQMRAETAAAVLDLATRTRASTLVSLRTRSDLTRRQVARLDALARRAERRSAKLAGRGAPAPTATVQTIAATPQTRAADGSRTLVVDAVAYHLPGQTASGLPVGPGIVAVDPSVIPLGTQMFIPGYGKGVAADVGSAVRGNIIDLWMPSRAKALAWGRRTVTITLYG
jgi:3D (Asp-Asp-Asp) domain-containing protein